jgi:hypothetical protein
MATKTKVEVLDGPSLPHLNYFSLSDANTTSLEPILAPSINSADTDSHQYLLVPNVHRIVVRSAHHGKRICNLIPDGRGVHICAVKLVWLPRHHVEHGQKDKEDNNNEDDASYDDDSSDLGEWVILAGCSNGVVQEWSVADLSDTSNSFEGKGPRRSFDMKWKHMKDLDLIHLTSVSTGDDTPTQLLSDGAVLYGLAKGTDKKSNLESTWLVRCEIPSFDAESKNSKASIPLTPLVAVKNVLSKDMGREIEQKKHVCLKTDDAIFGLNAAYRPSTNAAQRYRMDFMMNDDESEMLAPGDVFVVMCSSHGLVIYRNSLGAQQADASHELVHFTKTMKSSQYYTKEQTAFSSIAISPGTKDLALGRANGHIEILDNIFDNVADYLNQLGEKNVSEDSLQHPDDVTVRRTVHWHAHPVRALSFLTASGKHYKGGNNEGIFANPLSLLSGGEESVLVTWQLDRNFHKPSNFVARVGQGAIIHMVCSQSSGKVIVFCSDNSIQCYNASNYEREWADQGLASMALHEDDVKQENGPSKSPIIMVKDPITNYPMLTNLPGAPGHVHWYDPRSASVIGTLEVAPYNRVSRRDPLDPHIPAPVVTHMAVGQNGKDMVTVDTVWTENTSVGSSYELPGPQGMTRMNLCTSIKFWSYVEGAKSSDQRKRRNGDVPMSYDLVSAMVAPHGRDGEISALAVAPDGQVACTLSQEEDSFRVWVKTTDTSPTGAVSTHWVCQYKVKTPSGYANLLFQRDASELGTQLVTFSSDGSVLAVSYGHVCTLWDHSNATLLASLTIGDTATIKDIQSVNFLTENDDTILLTTASQFGVKSPFGGSKSCYLGNDEWSFNAGSYGKGGLVSAVVPLHDFECENGGNGGLFAVSIALSNGSRSVVSIISRVEGSVVYAKGTKKELQWIVEGEVESLCIDKCAGSSVTLLAITKDSQMLSLSCGPEKGASSMEISSTKDARPQAPVLKVGAGSVIEEPSVKKRKLTIGAMEGSNSKFSGFEFPALSGKFTSAFIAKSLGK